MQLAAIGFLFHFTVVGIAEMLVWLVCVIMLIMSKSEFYNLIDHLVCWLVIIYKVCTYHIVRWSLVWGFLVVYVEFLGLFQF
jgi:hypothetical protein